MAVIIKPRAAPAHPDYEAACRQTVTLYNKIPGQNEFHRTVFGKSAFLEHKANYQESRTGTTVSNAALLLIPQGASGKIYLDPQAFDALADKSKHFTLRNGDMAVNGVGPDIPSVKMPGIVTIGTVDILRDLDGAVVHVEGGGS